MVRRKKHNGKFIASVQSGPTRTGKMGNHFLSQEKVGEFLTDWKREMLFIIFSDI